MRPRGASFSGSAGTFAQQENVISFPVNFGCGCPQPANARRPKPAAFLNVVGEKFQLENSLLREMHRQRLNGTVR